MSNPVDEFEHAFQSCITALTSPAPNYAHDSEEVKTSVDQTVQRFLDSAKSMETFFLQKRLYLSVHKPELLIMEDIQEIKTEILRKDAVIQKFQEKLETWQGMLSEQPPPPPAMHSSQPHMSSHPMNTGIQTMTPGAAGVPMRGPHPGPMMPHPSQAMHPTQGMQSMTGMHTGMMGRMPIQGPMNSGMGGGPHMMAGPRPQMMPTGAPYQGGQPQAPPGFIQSQPSPQSLPPQQQQQQTPSPLAFLERTTSNIGLPEARR